MKRYTMTRLAASAVVAVALGANDAASSAFAATPDEFLDYVESSHAQYVDTGIEGRMGTKSELDIVPFDNKDTTILGCRKTDGGTDRIFLLHNFNGNQVGCGNYNTVSVGYGTILRNSRYVIVSEIDLNAVCSLAYNGNAADSATGTKLDPTGLNMYLFARNHAGVPAGYCAVRLYGGKIWQTDDSGAYKLVRDFVPCRKDGVAGLYDRVSEEIFYSKSGTALVAGNTRPAPTLAHRWSFNGDWSDSVGGADAAGCGTYVSLYGNRVHMGYGACSHGTGYVDLGTNMLDTTAATIEIWARHDGVQKWSRVFDYGADDTHYFYVGWSLDATPASERVEFYNSANGAKTYQDNTMGSNPCGYEIGKDYYIAVTFQNQGDGSTYIRWQRRDAATGALLGTGTMTAANGIHTFSDAVLYLGHSQYTSDRDALAAYDEVRVWSGVLAEDQIAASAAAGPDATITADTEGPRFVAAAAPEPPAQRAAVPNGGFRLMTYNVQFCYDEANTIIPDRTAARILAENPDFCCVNEVRDREDHPEATMLAKLTGMHKTFYGNLILSREEPLSREEIFLKMSPEGWGDRYCLICEFTNFCVAVTHLDTARESSGKPVVQATNALAIATIRAAFEKYTKPVFLCGDWNTSPTAENMDRFNEFLDILSPTNGIRTHHSHKATGGSILDYISVDKAHRDDFYVQSSYVVDDIVTSDHNPVIVELYCRPAVSGLGWVDESILTTGYTGVWSPAIAWDAASWKAKLDGENVFTPNAASGGSLVTVDVVMSFDDVPTECPTPANTAQAAVCLGTNGSFQVWTLGTVANVANAGNVPMWVDVAADGVTPQVDVEYAFRIVFDYRARTYSVELQDDTGGVRVSHPLRTVSTNATFPNGAATFPLAASGRAISEIRFTGDGVLTSMTGEFQKRKGSMLIVK